MRRPYEVWKTPPLIPKETKGNPSRAGMCFPFILLPWPCSGCILAGAVILAAGVFLAAVRVIARVHFVRDVAAGAAIGVGLGWIGFFLIPLAG